MKKKLSVLGFLIFLFPALTLGARNELGFFFTKGKPNYSQITKTFYGDEFQFFYGNKSFYLDISGQLASKQNSSDIANFDSNLFKSRIEISIWKLLVANLSLQSLRETEELFPFNQPQTIVVIDRWHKNEITAGLGIKVGRYDKSYLSTGIIFGSSYRRQIENLTFLDIKLSRHSSSRIIGLSIKGRLETRLYGPLIWLDFCSGYNYYTGNKHNTDVALGIGVKIIKNFRIKGSITRIKRIEVNDRNFKSINYSVGIVLTDVLKKRG